jgi:hypothetical protein
MRKLRTLSMAVVLTFTLSTWALAGTIETPPAPSVTATGITETPPSVTAPVTAPVASTDPVVDIALSLVLSALLLF